MTNHSTSDSVVLQALATERLLPAVVINDAAAAAPLRDAVVAGGLSTLEITLRTPSAIAAIRRLSEAGDISVGAGTVLTREQAKIAIGEGARFVVSPGLSPDVVAHCHDVGVPVFPGVATPTEILSALSLGCTVVKFFPADVNGGLPAIKALANPFPDVRFVPTGGVSADNLAAYLAHPAVLAVGGSWVVAQPLIASHDWATITSRVAEAVRIVEGVAAGDGAHA